MQNELKLSNYDGGDVTIKTWLVSGDTHDSQHAFCTWKNIGQPHGSILNNHAVYIKIDKSRIGFFFLSPKMSFHEQFTVLSNLHTTNPG